MMVAKILDLKQSINMAQSSTQKSKTKRNCMLVCLQKKHEDIPLPDGVSVMIGRSIETKITDPRCSRHQGEYFCK